MSESFDEKIRKTASHFRPEPNLKWSSIEKRLEVQQGAKTQMMFNWIAVAAGIALIALSVFVFQSSPNSGTEQSLYVSARHITDLSTAEAPNHRLGRYSVNEIYNAYQSAGLLPSASSDLNGRR